MLGYILFGKVKRLEKANKKAKIDGDAINAKVASKFETPEE